MRPLRATRVRQLHRKWSHLELSRHRARTHQYPDGMPHVRDTDTEARARRNFADWLRRVIEQKGMSKRALSRESGISRNDLDRWLNMETFPQPRSVRKFCDNLGLDYAEPARILGWSTGAEHSPDPQERAQFIRRARAMADHPDTSEELRRELKERIARAERLTKAAATSRLSADELDREAEALLRDLFPGDKGASGQ